MAPVAKPSTPNERAFNLIFSVFIEEMLHLQLAANMSNLLGFKPDFTSPALQNDKFGWICYDSTIIPHILDFKDCKAPYNEQNNGSQIELFLAIEETLEEARKHIAPDKVGRYFEPAPFDWWTPEMKEVDLPLFGSIGWMYTCFWDYLEIKYTDVTSLLDILTKDTNGNLIQRDELLDHYEVFTEVKSVIKENGYETWDTWHAQSGNEWKASMLNPENVTSDYNIPTAEEVAEALNELKSTDFDNNYNLLSQAAVGTIKGITTQLNDYWIGKIKQFPSPAMYGSGDRVSICWAVTGKVPKLWEDIDNAPNDILNHGCQGMDLLRKPTADDTCAAVEIYHSCKGSNTCKAQGGCGFVQNSDGGGNCSQSLSPTTKSVEGTCGLPTVSGHGGCAVPISASQLFPDPGASGSFVMQLFDFGDAPDFNSEPLEQMSYEKEDAVYDIA